MKPITVNDIASIKPRIFNLRDRALGCGENCPACGRICDAEHWREVSHAAGDY